MVHYFWSFFFLLSSIFIISIYVIGAFSLFFMAHYIAINNWQRLGERNFSPLMKSRKIGLKFLFFIIGPALVMVLISYIDYHVRGLGEVYNHRRMSDTGILYIFGLQLGVYLCFVFNTIKIQRLSKSSQPNEKTFLQHYFCWPRIKKVVIPVIACCLFVYVMQLQKWTGEDNAHYDAKKFWASGQVLNGFRLILTRFVHPEHLVLQPLQSLQQAIYRKGTALLPENDGEIGAWQNLWFIYHYSRRGRNPLFIKPSKSSAKMIELLDAEWFCLETMATKPFADRQMREDHYFRDYPSLALSYNFSEGWYTGMLVQSYRPMAKTPKYVERSEQLATWLWQLKLGWESSKDMQRFLAKHPKVEALWQAVLLFELEDVIHSSIFARDFVCDSKYIRWYSSIRKEFTEGKGNLRPAIERMSNRTQAERLYKLVVQRTRNRKIKYYVQEYCGIDIGGADGLKEYVDDARRRNTTPEKIAKERIIKSSIEEIPILEEIFDERN